MMIIDHSKDRQTKLTGVVELVASLVVRIVVESRFELVAIAGLSRLQTDVLLLGDLLFQLVLSLLVLLFDDLVLLAQQLFLLQSNVGRELMHAPGLTVLTRVEAIRIAVRAAAIDELLALSLHRIEEPLDERAVAVARVLVVVADVLKGSQGGRNVRALLVLLIHRNGESWLRQTSADLVAISRIIGDGRVAQSFAAFSVHESVVVRSATFTKMQAVG